MTDDSRNSDHDARDADELEDPSNVNSDNDSAKDSDKDSDQKKSDQDSQPSAAQSKTKVDPRLNSFLRQAAAIIAAERGLNPQSRLKLQSLADHLKIPSDAFAAAMEQLQTEDKKPKALDRYETAFLGFLEREYGKLPDAILSIAKQNRAIDYAQRKFQINELRAQQLIAQQARAMNVSCISRSEAKRFISQAIADRIGDARAIADEDHAQFFQLGQRWGVSNAEMDQLILAQLGKNRGGNSSGRYWLRPVLFLALIALLAGGVWLGLPYLNRGNPVSGDGTNAPDSDGPNPDQPAIQQSLQTEWWPSELSSQIQSLAEAEPKFAAVSGSLASEGSSQRQLGMSRAVELATGDFGASDDFQQVMAGLFSTEPDPLVVDAALQQLVTRLKFPQRQPATIRQVKSAFRANAFLVGMCYTKIPEGISDSGSWLLKIRKLVRDTTGIDPEQGDEKQQLENTERALAIDVWNHLQSTFWASSSRTTALLAPLYEMTSRKLSRAEVNQFRSQVLLGMFGSDTSRWRGLQRVTSDAIASADEIKINEWIKVFENSDDQPFREFLGPLLVKQSGVQTTSSSPRVIETALSAIRTDYRSKILKPVIDRNDIANSRMARAMQTSKDRLPERIAQIAYASNVGLSFSRDLEERSSRSNNDFKRFEKISAASLTSLETDVTLPNNQRATLQATERPTASDRRNKAETLNRLANFASTSSFARMTAVEKLSDISRRFEDVSYAEAKILAGYMLSDQLTEEESLNVEKHLSRFSHWPALSLAVCDSIVESNVSLDSMLTIGRELTGVPIRVSDQGNWRDKVRKQIFSNLMTKIENRLQSNPKSDRNDWRRLERYMLRVYFQRIELMNGSVSRSSAGDIKRLGSDWLESAIQFYDPRDATRFNRAIKINELRHEKSLGFLVANQQLMIQVIRDSRRERSLATQSKFDAAAADHELRMSSCENVGQQLELSELTLAKMWSIERDAIVQRQWKRN